MLYFYLCVSIYQSLYVCVCMSMCRHVPTDVRKCCWRLQSLTYKEVRSGLMWIMGTELRSSTRAVCNLDHSAISTTLWSCFLLPLNCTWGLYSGKGHICCRTRREICLVSFPHLWNCTLHSSRKDPFFPSEISFLLLSFQSLSWILENRVSGLHLKFSSSKVFPKWSS